MTGVGALYIRRRPRVRVEPIQSGGGQERYGTCTCKNYYKPQDKLNYCLTLLMLDIMISLLSSWVFNYSYMNVCTF